MLGRAAGLLARRSQQTQNALRCSGVSQQRCFAAGGAEKQPDNFIEPPISVHGSAGRYASALFSAASKAKGLEKTQKELREVQKLAVDSRDFARFIRDPTISREQKVVALDAVSADMKLSDITGRFMALLAENDRLAELPRIAETFDDIMAAVRGEVKATLTTAQALTPPQLEEVKENLSSVLKKGEKLFLAEKVDPSLIGGFIVDIGDKHMDMSTIARVKKVQQLIMEAVE